jgi:competence protein ComEC
VQLTAIYGANCTNPPGGVRSEPPPSTIERCAAAARAYPRHIVLGCAVAGLLIGSRSLPTVALVAAVAVLVSGALRLPAALTAVGVAAMVAAAFAGQARQTALDHTALRPLIGEDLTVRATLLEAPRATTTGGQRALVEMRGEVVLARVSRWVRTAKWSGLEAGDEALLAGTLQPVRSWDAWARTRGAHAVLRVHSARPTGRRRGGIAGALDAIRRRAEAGLDGGLDPPEAALARGMVLGQDDRLSRAAHDDFQRSGLAHILAASGQNVMLLAALALPLLAWAGLGLRARLAAVLGLVAIYVPLAGAGPSIQRAGIMGAAGLVAAIAGRRASRWYALLLAAAVTLTLDPRAVEDAGWQLSFAAVVAILALATPAREWLTARGVPHGLAEALALTGAATLGTAPLLAYHFDRVSLVSLPANLAATPAVAPAMWLGMLAAAAAQVAEPAARLIDALALYPLAFLEWLARASASLPGAAVTVHLGDWWEVASAYALAVAAIAGRRRLREAGRWAWRWWREAVLGARHEAVLGGRREAARRRRRLRFAGPLVAVLAVLVAVTFASGRTGGVDRAQEGLVVSFLDIGQGDATLIEDRGRTVLVDAGPPDGPIEARLLRAGVRRIDLLVVTHDQSDHEGGVPRVVTKHSVGLILDGAAGARTAEHAALVRAAAARQVRRIAPERGQVLRIGRIRFAVLWPPWPPPDPGGDPNHRAIVGLASVGRFDLLLPADAESDVTGPLPLPQVDALKVAHHGSADPGLPDLLARLRPRIAVVEVGKHNPYGHPTAQAMSALRASGTAVYRTDREGTVRLNVSGDRLRVG